MENDSTGPRESILLPHVLDALDVAAGRVKPATMADLKHRTRVRHIAWETAGTIRVIGGVTVICWDDGFGDTEVSPEGPVFPSDLEILGRMP